MTSIKWLIEQIKLDHIQKALSSAQWIKIFEQAKEMHKQEIIKSFEYGVGQGFISNIEKLEKLSNEFYEFFIDKIKNQQ